MLAASVGAKPQEIILQCDDYKDKTGLSEKFTHILESLLYFLEVSDVLFLKFVILYDLCFNVLLLKAHRLGSYLIQQMNS